NVGKLAICVDVVVDWSYRNVACRQNQVRSIYGPDNIHQAELMRFQLIRVRVHHDLPITATERLRHACAGNTRHLIADCELCQIAHLRFVETFSADGNKANRQARSIELQYDWR